MKKTIIVLLSTFTYQMGMTQNAQQNNDSFSYHHHELGLDGTSFIKQFLTFNNQSQAYFPLYYLTYRFHFKNNSNLRTAIGGKYKKENTKAPSSSDPNRAKDYEKSFDFRIGYELTKKLSKRWNAFYGMDLRPSVSHIKNDASGQINGYQRGTMTDIKQFGVAPLLGFKFEINSRVSLTTEASFSINYYEEFSHSYYKPLFDGVPPKPDDNKKDAYNWYSSLNQPLFIILVIDL
jgi:hypothetical protein